jgi:hypothetical protein
MEQNILRMPYELTRWILFSVDFSDIYLILLTQILTKLIIRYNKIGDIGTQHLADVLRDNTVIILFSWTLSCLSSSIHIDTHYIGSFMESNWRTRGTTSRWCFGTEQGDFHSTLFLSYVCSSIHIVSNYIKPPKQPNWNWWSTIFC